MDVRIGYWLQRNDCAASAQIQHKGRYFEWRQSWQTHAPGRHTLGTFNPIYPIGNYFGVLADTGPGPVNFIDVHPRIQTQLPRGISISTDVVAQWRENVNDGVYAVPGFLLVPANGSRARFVGYRPGAEVHWQINRHAYLQADYGIFYAGQYLKEASPGRDINYMEFWAGYKF